VETLINEQLKVELDSDAPYSFLEWKAHNKEQSDGAYSKYVSQWFVKHQAKPISKKFVTRQKYLYLLSQLQMFFSDEEFQSWYSKINLADEKELLLGIPYFAKKLKEITLYYLKLRKKLKNTKLKYNLIGSKNGLELQIKQKLIETFSTLNTELPPEIQTKLADPESLRQKLNVEVEEYYDDAMYFDRSSTVPLSSYVDLFHAPTAELFRTKGLELSSDSWIFNGLSVPSYENVENFVATLTGNIFETTDGDLYRSFIQKFLTEDKLLSIFESTSSAVTFNVIDLLSGNNNFFYPNGMVDRDSIKLEYVLDPVPLSSVVPEFGTAATDIQLSDTIYVKTGNNLKGAWLKYKEFEETNTALEAYFKANSKTAFVFPYPGYGLSAEDIEWTGNSLSATYEFAFLSENYKKAVNDRYWSQVLPNDTTEPLLINNTTLAVEGATSNKNPNNADQIYIALERPPDSFIFPGLEQNSAWLYRFEKTSLPITPELYSDSTIVWPYEHVKQAEDFPTQFNNFNFQNICEPLSIHQIDSTFAVAGDKFETAEKIYKLAKYNDPIENAVECCWLSGQTNTNENVQWVSQNGFSALFSPNTPTRFVWSGPDNTPLSAVFSFVIHAADCSLATDRTIKDPAKCSCKQVYYSPYGHSGETFSKNNSRSDYIAVDNLEDLIPFDIGSWKDSEGNAAANSKQFAWFKTEKEETWGYGKWVSKNGEEPGFLLKTGKRYVYNRTTSRDNSPFPIYSVNFKYPQFQAKWIQARKTEEETWISTEELARTEFHAGDFIKWDRKSNTTNYFLSSILVANETKRLSSLWASFDQVALDNELSNSTTLTFPFNASITSDVASTIQLPTLSAGRWFSFTDIVKVHWWKITNTSDLSSAPLYIYDDVMPTFTPKVTGTYFIEASAEVTTRFNVTTAGIEEETQDVYVGSNVIPPIYVIPKHRIEFSPIPIETPTSNFLLEQPLVGWNYNQKNYDSISLGAKPYWATLNLNKDENTKFKSLFAWGYNNVYLNEYLPDFAPKVSNIEFQYGNVINYIRKGPDITWSQPLTFKKFVGTSEWCEITGTPTSFGALSSLYSVGSNINPVVFATPNPSTIQLTNFAEGNPVEVFYNAINSFQWTLSVVVPIDPVNLLTSSIELESSKPWTVYSNRFNPTIATAPELSKLFTQKEVGGFFVPEKLGASQYINQDFTPIPLSSNNNFIAVTEDTSTHIGGRGLTKQDQSTLYSWSEDNRWLKEPSTTNKLVGAIKKNLSKTLQSFVPYQTKANEKQIGLIHTDDRRTPWGGSFQNQWIDNVIDPTNITGIRSMPFWSNAQISQEFGKIMDSWVTDIYGNQYGLFKQSLSAAFGEVWVRKNTELLSPSYIALSAVYTPIRDLSLSTYKQLTGEGIKNFDCFADTLMIQTSSTVIFAKINYDYNIDKIESTLDDIKFIDLNNFLSSNSKTTFDQLWYFPNNNKLVCSLVSLSGQKMFPELYELNLNTNEFFKQYPQQEELISLQRSLSSLEIKSIESNLLTYNKTLKQFLITTTGTLSNDKPFVNDIIVDERQYYTTNSVKTYLSFETISAPYIINYNTPHYVISTETFNIVLSSTEPVTNIQFLSSSNYSFISNINNTFISLTGVINLANWYDINYTVSNAAGTNTFSLLITAAPAPTPTATPTPTPTPTPTATPIPIQTLLTTISGDQLITINGDVLIAI
jgi:hypothetical protein